MSYENNVVIKRDSIKLERDSTNKDVFYISFAYQAFSNINFSIFFNSKIDYNNDSVISDFPCRKVIIPQSHVKIQTKNQFSNFTKDSGEGMITNMEEYKTFLESSVYIDLNSYFSQKIFDASFIDVLFLFDFLNNSRLYMFFKLTLTSAEGISVKSYDQNIKNIKVNLKYVTQKLKYLEYWYDMHDIYGLASKNNDE